MGLGGEEIGWKCSFLPHSPTVLEKEEGRYGGRRRKTQMKEDGRKIRKRTNKGNWVKRKEGEDDELDVEPRNQLPQMTCISTDDILCRGCKAAT